MTTSYLHISISVGRQADGSRPATAVNPRRPRRATGPGRALGRLAPPRGERDSGVAAMTRIAHIMTPQPATILTTATAGAAAALMVARGLRHLPLVDQTGRLVGIVSDRDLRGPMIGNDAGAPAPALDAPVATIA
ncbi:MAG: CBS domain-containing protein [Myxococcales bacterium]|nr:CBS domain-containing protein [Myxococcales bacterium]